MYIGIYRYVHLYVSSSNNNTNNDNNNDEIMHTTLYSYVIILWYTNELHKSARPAERQSNL